MESKPVIRKIDASDEVFISTIADWYNREWNTPIDETIRKLSKHKDDNFPLHFVLTIEDELISTGGLRNNVNIFKSHEKLKMYKPWISLFYTRKDRRNKGYGKMLLRHIENYARLENLSKIYLYTFTAESFYLKYGWNEIDRVRYKGEDTAVMEKIV